MNTNVGVVAIALCVMAGCGGSVMSPSKLAASEGAVRGAEELGAARMPKAGLHLKLAKDQLVKAKAASKNGQGDTADGLLARSQADADLAIALANEASADRSADQVNTEVQSAKAQVKEGVK